MKTGQQSNLGQHQQLRCFGIQTEIKTKNNQLGKVVAWTKMKRRGKMSCEPKFLSTAKFRGFKTTEMARKNESQSDYKQNSFRIVHWEFAEERELWLRKGWLPGHLSLLSLDELIVTEQWQHELWSAVLRISLNEVKEHSVQHTPDWLCFVGHGKTVTFKTAWGVCITKTSNRVFIVFFVRLGFTFCEFQESLLTSYGKFGRRAAASNSAGKIPGECVWFCPMADVFVQCLDCHEIFRPHINIF